MRDIKFRAINAKGEIIYGLPYTDTVNETSYFKEYNNRLCWRNKDGIHCNQPYKNGTLSQYTGLKDKNGVEIYEGDVATQGDGRNFEISFCENDGAYAVGAHLFSGFSKYYWKETCEVIGNIFQNKGLLNDSYRTRNSEV